MMIDVQRAGGNLDLLLNEGDSSTCLGYPITRPRESMVRARARALGRGGEPRRSAAALARRARARARP